MIPAILITIATIVILIVIYIFLTLPRVFDSANMDLLATDYAHRGLHDESIPENSLAEIPEAASVIVDAYRALKYTKWTSDGEALSDLMVGTEDVTFRAMEKPTMEDENRQVVPYMSGMLVNYTLTSHWQITYYFPVVDGVTITAFRMDTSERLGNASQVYIGGQLYTKNSLWPGSTSIANGVTAKLSYIVDGIESTANFKITIADYATYIIDQQEGATVAEKTMAADAVNYAYTVAKYASSSYSNSACEAFLSNYAQYLSKDGQYQSYNLPENIGNISDYVSDFSYALSGNGMAFKISLTEKAKTDGVKFAVKRIYDKGGMALTLAEDGSYYRTGNTGTLKYMRAGFIVTVSGSDGTVLAQYSFCMKTILEGMDKQDANYQLYRAVYNLANSSANFQAYKK